MWIHSEELSVFLRFTRNGLRLEGATPVGEIQVRTRILLHTFTLILTWEQTAGETVRTQPPIAARSARGNTGTRAGPNEETGEKCASLTPGSHGPLHRETAWLGVGLRADY